MREIMIADAPQRQQSTTCALPLLLSSQYSASIVAVPVDNESHLEITVSTQTALSDAVIQRGARKLVEVARLISEQACAQEMQSHESNLTFSVATDKRRGASKGYRRNASQQRSANQCAAVVPRKGGNCERNGASGRIGKRYSCSFSTNESLANRRLR